MSDTDGAKRSQHNQMLFLIYILPLLSHTTAKVDTGTLSNLQNWQFISRFCYKGGVGASSTSDKRKFRFKVDYEAESCGTDLTLALYYDSPEQWASVYKSNLSCEQRVGKARGRIQLVSMLGACSYQKTEKICKCDGSRFLEGMRARWWYVAISSCRPESRINIRAVNYTLTFTNGDHFTDKHFSADEIGITETNFVVTVLMIFIFVITSLYANLLVKRRLYHGTFKLFQCSVFLYLCRCVLTVFYHSIYGVRGHAPTTIYRFGQVFEVLSTCIFLGLLLSFASGYTIVMSALTVCGFGALVSFTGMFSLFMFASLIWEWNVFDPAAVLYTYQSPPGIFLTVIYFPAWVYFICNCVYTGAKFRRKIPFYIALGYFYSVWLLAIPLLILIANKYLEDWERMKTVTIAQQMVWILSYSYLLFIFRPAHGNKHFPFHLRATKVGTDLNEETAQDNNYEAEPGAQDKDANNNEHVELQQDPPVSAYADIFTVVYDTAT
ncbi:transmembrane protein 145-like [Bolinopsis microptera]|uniref:transmembrane protein 145-like n=1 Tax=Bolinopsis microptera TaxID=2820187 RepID=UPI0030795BA9